MLKLQKEELSKLLIEYAAGNYSAKGKLSTKQDEVDMIIQGINMLGEELEATNVSKDYFLSIYNAVTDLIIITDNNSIITDINNATSNLFQINDKYDVIGKSIYHILGEKKHSLLKFEKISDSNPNSHTFEGEIEFNNIKIIGLLTNSRIIDRSDIRQGFLIKIKDITEAKQTERKIIQTIVRTEQNEQKRMADELHDSLAQEIAMAKLMVTNLEKFSNNNKEFITLIETAKHILDEAIKHTREICFNLMPSVLIKADIDIALNDFVKKLNTQNFISFEYTSEGNFEELNSELEIMIYRITQEFINNTIKHANAKNVYIKTQINESDEFYLELIDDGIGFNPKKLKLSVAGRGISNLESKVKAFDGNYTLTSKVNHGTKLEIRFPKIKI